MNITNDNLNNTEPQPETEDLDEDALRRRLINRIALAGVAIVALLGGLAIIDSMYVAPPAPRQKAATTPIMADALKPQEAVPPAEAEKQAAPEAKPVEEPAAPEPPKPEAIPSIKAAVAPEESAAPTMPLPRQPRPLTKMPEVRQAAAKSTAPQELAHQPLAPPVTHAPPSRPLTQSVQAERRFVLQMGVFNNVDNAQELLAKLQKGGIPAQIEARVQVGPFNTKAEADEARAKLKAMGLDAGLLMAIHR